MRSRRRRTRGDPEGDTSLSLRRGHAVDIRERDGRIEIGSVATAMSLVRRSGGAVAVSGEMLPLLTDELVRDTLERTGRCVSHEPGS